MYANDVLVETGWLEAHLDDPSIRIVEVDENPALYADAHVPGAIGFDWKADLQDGVRRAFLGPEAFGALFGAHGVSNDHTIVLYGDRNNWFAAYTYWYLKYYGHASVKLLNGPREKWTAEGRPITAAVPEHEPQTFVAQRGDRGIRALRDEVLDSLGDGHVLVDVRSPQEYSGELIAMPAAATSRARSRSRGRRRSPRTARSSRSPTCCGSTATTACSAASRSSPTAASASARRTRGSCCTSCSATRTSRTTTARGPSGAT
jgi:3-mercaptopyruvate sulfurtransferase SseA